MMYLYEVYGLIAESDIEFPQLLKYQGEKGPSPLADITITVTGKDELRKRFSAVIDRGGNWGLTDNGRWFSNQAGVFLLETVGDKSVMQCERFEGVPDQMIRSFFLGNCIAIILTQRKKLVLHGSSILIGDKTVLVCGDSGTGKSTTSMELIRRGGRLMSDDISVLDVNSGDGKIYAWPGFPEQKLCRDAALDNGYDTDELTYIDEDRDKFSVDRREIFVNEKHPVSVLLTLHTIAKDQADSEFENGVRIKEITGADKVNAITDRFFLIWMYRDTLKFEPAEMMKCVAMAGQIRIFDITRVREEDTKEYLFNKITELLK